MKPGRISIPANTNAKYANPDSAIVFAKWDIQYPVHTVLDSPLSTHGFPEQGRFAREIADVVAAFYAGYAGVVSANDFSRRFDHDQAAQPAPVLVLFLQPGDAIGHQTASGFNPSMIFFCLDIISVWTIQLACIGDIEP